MAIINAKSAGITALSGLTIDTDKDWLGFGISVLEELAAGMTIGDLLQRGAGGVLIKLSPGPPGNILTANGAGNIIGWAPPS